MSQLIIRYLIVVTCALAVNGCSKTYSYLPTAPAFIYSNIDRNKFEVVWSSEWQEWARSNDVLLNGLYVFYPNCGSRAIEYEFERVIVLEVSDDNSIEILSDLGASHTIHCEREFSRVGLAPAYEEQGFDPGDWAQETFISLPEN